MKTKDYINLLQAVKGIPGEKSGEMIDEIIQRLREYDELQSALIDLIKFLEERVYPYITEHPNLDFTVE